MGNDGVVIVGGGLAGLASGIHLARAGVPVTIIEKSRFPKHKVCGEYISNEVLPYLKWLDADVSVLNPVTINRFEFSTISGKSVGAHLPLGGFGISRYALDNFLYEKALENGCIIKHDTVTDVSFDGDTFSVRSSGAVLKASIVLGAYGKRSNLDQMMSRTFFSKKSPWLAVKGHYKGHFPGNLVALHNFPGGYCGISCVEDNLINICYLADYETFRQHKNIEEYQAAVLCVNPHLKKIFSSITPVFEQPLAISQVSFESKATVENHILMIGDTAGLIHPLCGNGMAMAINSAAICSELVLDYLAGRMSRAQMEERYRKSWKSRFSRRMQAGRILAGALRKPRVTKALMHAVTLFPALLTAMIKQTQGKPLAIPH